MKSIKYDLDVRNKINDDLFNHIEKLSNSDITGNVDICLILKSSLYIAMYNNIEATIYSILEKFHNEISRYTYMELIPELRNKIADYHFGNKQELNTRKKIQISNIILSGNYKLPQLKEFMSVKVVFSGNLNLRIIRNIFKSYGANITNVAGKAEDLLSVTTKRNKIAHGEQSLKEAGRISNKTLQAVKCSVSSILDNVISRSELYLNNREYLIPTNCSDKDSEAK